MKREELDNRMREYFDKYDVIAHRIGVAALKSVMPFKRDEVREALKTDIYMNNLPLKQWDACDYTVRNYLLHGSGIKSWSLSDTVCVLKHVARHYYV